jgi:hypothetical protein
MFFTESDYTNQKITDAVKELKPNLLRIPGGTMADSWDWDKGGVIDPKGFNFPANFKYEYGPGLIQQNYHSYQNVKNFLAKTNTKPLFVLNIITKNLDTQVAYLKSFQKIGVPIEYIEIGNEPYLFDNTLHPKADQYAKLATEWNTRLKQEFPEAKIAYVAYSPNISNPRAIEKASTWNNSVSSVTGTPSAAFHIYTDTTTKNNSTSEIDGQNLRSLSNDDIKAGFATLNKKMSVHVSDEVSKIPSDKKLWATEYNFVETGDRFIYAGTWAQGLFTTLNATLLAQNPRYEIVCNHVLYGDTQWAAIFGSKNNSLGSQVSKQSVSYNFSSGGQGLKMFGNAFKDADSLVNLEFKDNLKQISNGVEYPGLIGYKLSSGSEERFFILNLTDQQISLDLSKLSTNELTVNSVFSDPKKLILNNQDISKNTYNTKNKIVKIEKYSISTIYPNLYLLAINPNCIFHKYI